MHAYSSIRIYNLRVITESTLLISSMTTIILSMLDILGDLVQAYLLGNPLTTLQVLLSRGVFEDLSSASTLQTKTHLVNLLQGEALELREDEDGVQETNEAEAHEYNVCLPADVVDHHWRDHCDGEVHDPVSGRGYRHALCPHV